VKKQENKVLRPSPIFHALHPLLFLLLKSMPPKKIECTNFFLAESAKDFFGANTFFQFHALQLLSCQSMFRLKARNVVLEEALSW
jgi:hypothetical protein